MNKKNLCIKSSNIFRQTFLLLFSSLLSFIVRYPRDNGIIGRDAYYFIKASFLFINGEMRAHIHFLSYLGMYTFSPYPVGSLLVFGTIIKISGNNLILATWLYLVLMIIIGTASSRFLFGVFFENKKVSWLLAILYVNVPYVVNFSYWYPSPRLLFIALAPFFYYFLFQFLKTKKKRYLVYMVLSYLLLLFTHRISLIIILSSIVVIFMGIEYLPNKDKIKRAISFTNKHFSLFFILGICIFLVLNFIFIADFLPSSASIVFRSQSDLGRFLEAIVIRNIIARFGPLFIPCFFGFIMFSKTSIPHADTGLIKYALISVFPFVLVLQNIYVPYLIMFQLLLLVGIYICTYREFRWLTIFNDLLLCFFFIVGFPFIHFNVVNISFYHIIAPIFGITGLLIVLFSNLNFTFSRIKTSEIIQQFKTYFIFIIILFYSFFIIDFSNKYVPQDSYFPYLTLTDEEREIITFFNNLNESKGMFDSFSRYMGARISMYTDWYHLADPHSICLLQLNIHSPDQVINNSTLNAPWHWGDLYIYNYTLRDAVTIHTILLRLHSGSELAKDIITQYNIKYYITLKNSTVAEYSTSSYGKSLFIETIHLHHSIVFETESYQLWNLTYS